MTTPNDDDSSSDESVEPLLSFIDGDIETLGLTANVFSNGQLRVQYAVGEYIYFCLFDLGQQYSVVDSNMPSGVLTSTVQEMRAKSLEEAMLKIPKRLTAYHARQYQVEKCVERCHESLVGNKIETTGACTFVRIDLKVDIEDQQGVVRIDLTYPEFSVHPAGIDIFAKGSLEYCLSVKKRANDMTEILETMELSDACAMFVE